MGTKGISVTQVKMFCEMVDQKFKPLFELASEKRHREKDRLRQSLMDELRISELHQALLASIENTKRLEQEIKVILITKGLSLDRWGSSFIDKLEQSLDEIVTDRNILPDGHTMLAREKSALQDQIKLATVGTEIANIFEKIDAKFAELANKL